MGESILVLSLIIFFCIITDLIIIKKGNAVTLETMGIGLEMRCPDVNVNMISEKNFSMKEVSGIILFVQNDCNTCETVVNTMENSDLKNNNLYTIIVGEEEEAISFMGKHSSWERVGFLDFNDVKEKIKITAFPFYMLLKNGIVKEKGFPRIDVLKKDNL